MILGFNPMFVEPILEGNKIHTLRKDTFDRWKPWRTAQMATGVRTKNYRMFDERIIVSTQRVDIKHTKAFGMEVRVEGRSLTQPEIELLARNDGFKSYEDFEKWFSEDFSGKIIHWTPFKY